MPLNANVHQCTHVKIDGIRCGSPALRGQQFCYFHHHSADHCAKRPARMLEIPFPEDAAAVQVGLHNVMLAILDRRIDQPRAAQLLWALQIASNQGRHLPFDNMLRRSRCVTELPEYEVAEQQAAEASDRYIKEQQAALTTAQSAATRDDAAPAAGVSATTGESAWPTLAPKDGARMGHRGAGGVVEGTAVPARKEPAPAALDAMLERACGGDWQATEKLFRATGLMPRRRRRSG